AAAGRCALGAPGGLGTGGAADRAGRAGANWICRGGDASIEPARADGHVLCVDRNNGCALHHDRFVLCIAISEAIVDRPGTAAGGEAVYDPRHAAGDAADFTE